MAASVDLMALAEGLDGPKKTRALADLRGNSLDKSAFAKFEQRPVNDVKPLPKMTGKVWKPPPRELESLPPVKPKPPKLLEQPSPQSVAVPLRGEVEEEPISPHLASNPFLQQDGAKRKSLTPPWEKTAVPVGQKAENSPTAVPLLGQYRGEPVTLPESVLKAPSSPAVLEKDYIDAARDEAHKLAREQRSPGYHGNGNRFGSAKKLPASPKATTATTPPASPSRSAVAEEPLDITDEMVLAAAPSAYASVESPRALPSTIPPTVHEEPSLSPTRDSTEWLHNLSMGNAPDSPQHKSVEAAITDISDHHAAELDRLDAEAMGELSDAAIGALPHSPDKELKRKSSSGRFSLTRMLSGRRNSK